LIPLLPSIPSRSHLLIPLNKQPVFLDFILHFASLRQFFPQEWQLICLFLRSVTIFCSRESHSWIWVEWQYDLLDFRGLAKFFLPGWSYLPLICWFHLQNRLWVVGRWTFSRISVFLFHGKSTPIHTYEAVTAPPLKTVRSRFQGLSVPTVGPITWQLNHELWSGVRGQGLRTGL